MVRGRSREAMSSRHWRDSIGVTLVLALACGGTRAPASEAPVEFTIPGKSKFAAPEPATAHPPASAAAAPIPAPAGSARLPPPEGQPQSTLGFTRAVDGCVRGYAYRVASTTPALSDDYAEGAPTTELWGCEWAFSNATLSAALPGAQAGQAYAVRYQGSFQVVSSGIFRFGAVSSSALRFSVDGALVVERGAAGTGGGEQGVYLGAGRHQVVVEYLAAGNSLALNITIAAPGAAAAPFSVRPSSPFYAEQGLDYTGPAGGVGQSWREMVDVQTDALELKGRIFFRTGSAELNREDQSEAALLAVAKTLSEHPNVRCVEIQGHTDARGEAERNVRLSRARARTVRDWLVQAGVQPHRLATRGFGGEQAAESNSTDAGRAANRRVEFLLHPPNADGSCPHGDAVAGTQPVVRERPAAPDEAERACAKRAEVQSALASELGPWLAGHQTCASDADCTEAVPLSCPGKSKGLACGWALVNQESVEDLRVYGARLDSLKSYCSALPEDHLVRSCGGCAAKALRCDSGKCTFSR